MAIPLPTGRRRPRSDADHALDVGALVREHAFDLTLRSGSRPDAAWMTGWRRTPGQGALEIVVVVLDGLHGRVHRLADVGALGQLQQGIVAGFVRQVHHVERVVFVLADAAAPPALLLQLLLRLGEALVRIAQEDQRQHRRRILARLQAGVGPKLVGRVPKALLEFRRQGHVPEMLHPTATWLAGIGAARR
jgi:hypothetical protein